MLIIIQDAMDAVSNVHDELMNDEVMMGIRATCRQHLHTNTHYAEHQCRALEAARQRGSFPVKKNYTDYTSMNSGNGTRPPEMKNICSFTDAAFFSPIFCLSIESARCRWPLTGFPGCPGAPGCPGSPSWPGNPRGPTEPTYPISPFLPSVPLGPLSPVTPF